MIYTYGLKFGETVRNMVLLAALPENVGTIPSPQSRQPSDNAACNKDDLAGVIRKLQQAYEKAGLIGRGVGSTNSNTHTRTVHSRPYHVNTRLEPLAEVPVIPTVHLQPIREACENESLASPARAGDGICGGELIPIKEKVHEEVKHNNSTLTNPIHSDEKNEKSARTHASGCSCYISGGCACVYSKQTVHFPAHRQTIPALPRNNALNSLSAVVNEPEQCVPSGDVFTQTLPDRKNNGEIGEYCDVFGVYRVNDIGARQQVVEQKANGEGLQTSEHNILSNTDTCGDLGTHTYRLLAITDQRSSEIEQLSADKTPSTVKIEDVLTHGSDAHSHMHSAECRSAAVDLRKASHSHLGRYATGGGVPVGMLVQNYAVPELGADHTNDSGGKTTQSCPPTFRGHRPHVSAMLTENGYSRNYSARYDRKNYHGRRKMELFSRMSQEARYAINETRREMGLPDLNNEANHNGSDNIDNDITTPKPECKTECLKDGLPTEIEEAQNDVNANLGHGDCNDVTNGNESNGINNEVDVNKVRADIRIKNMQRTKTSKDYNNILGGHGKKTLTAATPITHYLYSGGDANVTSRPSTTSFSGVKNKSSWSTNHNNYRPVTSRTKLPRIKKSGLRRKKDNNEPIDVDMVPPEMGRYKLLEVNNNKRKDNPFEITPPGYDSRYNDVINFRREGSADSLPAEVKAQAVAKCNEWLTKYS